MRKIQITVADMEGVVLDHKEAEIRDCIRELVVLEVLPGTVIIEHTVADLVIGDPDTTG